MSDSIVEAVRSRYGLVATSGLLSDDDWVRANCVINLALDKRAAFREAIRRVAVEQPAPYASCFLGARRIAPLKSHLQQGLRGIQQFTHASPSTFLRHEWLANQYLS